MMASSAEIPLEKKGEGGRVRAQKMPNLPPLCDAFLLLELLREECAPAFFFFFFDNLSLDWPSHFGRCTCGLFVLGIIGFVAQIHKR